MNLQVQTWDFLTGPFMCYKNTHFLLKTESMKDACCFDFNTFSNKIITTLLYIYFVFKIIKQIWSQLWLLFLKWLMWPLDLVFFLLLLLNSRYFKIRGWLMIGRRSMSLFRFTLDPCVTICVILEFFPTILIISVFPLLHCISPNILFLAYFPRRRCTCATYCWRCSCWWDNFSNFCYCYSLDISKIYKKW